MGEAAALLLVDDDPAVLRLMERILARSEDWEATTAVDAESARSAARATLPRVAVIDLGLQPGGGVALGQVLREDHPELGLIFVSGAPPESADREWIDSAGAHFLGKPFGPAPFMSLIEAAGAKR